MRADGFRSERITDLSRDATIRLRRGIPVKVVVRPEGLPCLLVSSLTPVGEPSRWFRRGASIAHDNDAWRFEFVTGSKISVPGGSLAENDPGLEEPSDPEEADLDEFVSRITVGTTDPGIPRGVLQFAVGDPGAFELRLWDQEKDRLIPIPRESAVLQVKDMPALQTFEIHLDPDRPLAPNE